MSRKASMSSVLLVSPSFELQCQFGRTVELEFNIFCQIILDQAVKMLCDIWHPQDIPNTFLTLSHATVAGAQDGEPLTPLITKYTINQFHSRNTQLPSPISPLTQPSPISPLFMPMHAPHQADHCIAFQTNLMPIKGFVHEVLCQSRTSGSVLQMALCYLEAICAKVPELIEKEKMGDGVQGEPDIWERLSKATSKPRSGESCPWILSWLISSIWMPLWTLIQPNQKLWQL
jgi:hypothetical protein